MGIKLASIIKVDTGMDMGIPMIKKMNKKPQHELFRNLLLRGFRFNNFGLQSQVIPQAPAHTGVSTFFTNE